MHYRKLGKTNLKVSEIGFGAWQIGGGNWGKQDDAEAIKSVQLALDLGVNFIDTALVYGDGHSEKLVGQAIGDRRDSVVIASKIPPKTWENVPNQPIDKTFPADWVIQCTEKSLSNLKIERLDLQQFHAWSPAYVQQTAWLDGVNKLKKQGKIKSFGVSANDWDPYGTVEATRRGMVDSIQVIFNIFEQRPAEKLFPAALEANVGIIVRVPFEEGLLTGQFGPEVQIDPNDWRSKWLTPARRGEAAKRVEALRQFLAPDHSTLAALALKFCLSHPAVSTVIPGMRKTNHVRSNCAVSDGKLLPEADLQKLHEHQFVHGWPYPWAEKRG
jgi:aryl-alcohol dehydrogenase-like predicted oxidoreductase